ncbi:MAG: hypothetical protein AAGM84_02825 [Pseudomonadota bacterium]
MSDDGEMAVRMQSLEFLNTAIRSRIKPAFCLHAEPSFFVDQTDPAALRAARTEA